MAARPLLDLIAASPCPARPSEGARCHGSRLRHQGDRGGGVMALAALDGGDDTRVWTLLVSGLEIHVGT